MQPTQLCTCSLFVPRSKEASFRLLKDRHQRLQLPAAHKKELRWTWFKPWHNNIGRPVRHQYLHKTKLFLLQFASLLSLYNKIHNIVSSSPTQNLQDHDRREVTSLVIPNIWASLYFMPADKIMVTPIFISCEAILFVCYQGVIKVHLLLKFLCRLRQLVWAWHVVCHHTICKINTLFAFSNITSYPEHIDITSKVTDIFPKI